MGRVKRLEPTAKPKKVTGADLLAEAEKYNQPETITLNDGRTTKIITNPSNASINKMLDSCFQFISELLPIRQAEGEEIDDANFIDFLNLHIMLYFTKIPFEIPKTIDAKVAFFDKLLEIDVLEEIFELMDKKDISKIYERFYKRLETYLELVKTNKEYQKAFKEKVKEMNLENFDVINDVMFQGKLNDDENEVVEDGEVSGEKNV